MCNGSMEGIAGDLQIVATGERRGANGEEERQILDTCLGLDICLTPLYIRYMYCYFFLTPQVDQED